MGGSKQRSRKPCECCGLRDQPVHRYGGMCFGIMHLCTPCLAWETFDVPYDPEDKQYMDDDPGWQVERQTKWTEHQTRHAQEGALAYG